MDEQQVMFQSEGLGWAGRGSVFTEASELGTNERTVMTHSSKWLLVVCIR